MNKDKIVNELQNTLSKFEGEEVRRVIGQIRSELNDVLNNYISENKVYDTDFPIEFENGLGKWEINSDGEAYVWLKMGVQHITVDLTIKPT